MASKHKTKTSEKAVMQPERKDNISFDEDGFETVPICTTSSNWFEKLADEVPCSTKKTDSSFDMKPLLGSLSKDNASLNETLQDGFTTMNSNFNELQKVLIQVIGDQKNSN